MRLESIAAGTVLLAAIPVAAPAQSDEEQFQEMVAALQANDGERRAVIATCIAQGIGNNPTGAAKFMCVPVEEAAQAWCTRMTNGSAEVLTAAEEGR